MCCKWVYHWKICRLTLRDLYYMTYRYIFLSKFFWDYYWDMTSSCLHKRCRKYSNFVGFLRLQKRIILKNMIFVFLLLQMYKPKYNSWNNNRLNRTLQKLDKMRFFKVTSQKHHKLMYIKYNQRYSDNKYLNKVQIS